MGYDFVKDVMIIEGVEYALKPYRKWLIQNHEQLVNGHFIKALTVGGQTKFYYDWQAVYFLSAEYGFVNNYLTNHSQI
jgi:hypothetical protein